MCNRDKGTPSLCGISQASALTSTATLGGKDRRATVPGAFLKTRQAFVEEPFPPLQDDLAREIDAVGDGLIGQAEGSIEDDFGAHDVAIR
jgi:hypothetical protein